MTIPTILLPLFVQVGLVFAVGIMLALRRGRVLSAGEVNRSEIALDEAGWPDYCRQANNNLLNQYQFPVLFYVVVILALITRKADLLFVVLEWVFVLSRIVHASVHLGSNNLRARALSFGFGVVVLLVMWLLFAVHILLGV